MKKILTVLLFAPFFCFGQLDSLDIKIGQMIIMGLDNFKKLDKAQPMFADIQSGKLGNVILFGKHIDKKKPEKSLSKITAYIHEIAPIKPFIAIDEEGGKVNRLKPKYGFTETRSAMYLGNLDMEDSTRYFAKLSGETMRSSSINMNFAPVVDVDINDKNPVIGGKERSYSPDAEMVAKHAAYVIEEQDKLGIVNVLKHFPGHGSSAADTHLGIADVSDTWRVEELYPYRILMDQGAVKAIMMAHIVNDKLDTASNPATLSKRIINDLLRKFMGFKGVIISDDMQMQAITKYYGFEEALVISINAGVDMLAIANNTELEDIANLGDIHAMIKKNVLDGFIPESRINQSFRRIMELKKSMK